MEISGYVDPGTYISEKIAPSAISVNSTPKSLCIIGTGKRTRRSTNEAVARGLVRNESVTFADGVAKLANVAVRRASLTAVYADGAEISDDYLSFTRPYIEGVRMLPSDFGLKWLLPLNIDGRGWVIVGVGCSDPGAPVHVGIEGNLINVSVPGAAVNAVTAANVVLAINSGLAGAASLGYGPAYGNVASEVDGVITILSPSAGPGADVQITRAFPAENDATDIVFGTTLGTPTLRASTCIRLDDEVLSDSAAYTVDYVAIDSDMDALASADVTKVTRVGSYVNVNSFQAGPDYRVEPGYIAWQPGTAASVAGSVHGDFDLGSDSKFYLSLENQPSVLVYLRTGADGIYMPNGGMHPASEIAALASCATWLRAFEIGMMAHQSDTYHDIADDSPTPGGNDLDELRYATRFANELKAHYNAHISSARFHSQADRSNVVIAPDATTLDSLIVLTMAIGRAYDAHRVSGIHKLPDTVNVIADLGDTAIRVTPAEVAQNINAHLAADRNYGPLYSSVATVVDGRIVLTSPVKGSTSHIGVSPFGVTETLAKVFGLPADLTTEAAGTGKRPVPGATYFVTYDFARPATDYNRPMRFYSQDQAIAWTGAASDSNALAVATDIAFENGVPFIWLCQIDDSTIAGQPTKAQILAALTGCASKTDITDYVILDTKYDTAAALYDYVTSQSSPTEKGYCRAWFGTARGTPIGDKDTPGSLIYTATRVFKVDGESPGRGRFMVCAPPNVSRVITTEVGGRLRKYLDGSYVALAQAARFCSFANSYESLLNKTIRGFETDDFQEYLNTERRILAPNGVSVVTLKNGKLVCTDPVTTEKGGAGLAAFSSPECSSQKDGVTRAIEMVVDSNLLGVTPDNLETFILTIRGWIGQTLNTMIRNREIAAYKTPSGATRGVDYNKDIIVYQDPTDPHKFRFRYTYNLKYVAKQFMGEFSVDNPFWVE